MAEQSGQTVNRLFEQGTEAITFYSDFAQVLSTGHEVVIQFYETIPGPPTPDGKISTVRSRLRSTITVSYAHAVNIGNLLLKQKQLGVPEEKR